MPPNCTGCGRWFTLLDYSELAESSCSTCRKEKPTLDDDFQEWYHGDDAQPSKREGPIDSYRSLPSESQRLPSALGVSDSAVETHLPPQEVKSTDGNTEKPVLSFKDRDLKTLVSMLEAEVTKWDKGWKGPIELEPISASASSSGTEGWNFGEKRFIDFFPPKEYPGHMFRPTWSGYYCAKYFIDRISDGDSFLRCIREIEKLSLIALEPAESMEELREAVRETKEKFPEARLVNAPEEHLVRDPDALSKVRA